MLNLSIIMGRLTADPELKQTPNGKSVCSFTVAVDRDYAPQGQEQQADFICVTAWNKTAEFVSKYFSKGKMIAVEGQLRTRSYDDRRYPVKHYITEIYADKVSFCGDKTVNDTSNDQTTKNQPTQTAENEIVDLTPNDFEDIISDSDLPF